MNRNALVLDPGLPQLDHLELDFPATELTGFLVGGHPDIDDISLDLPARVVNRVNAGILSGRHLHDRTQRQDARIRGYYPAPDIGPTPGSPFQRIGRRPKGLRIT